MLANCKQFTLSPRLHDMHRAIPRSVTRQVEFTTPTEEVQKGWTQQEALMTQAGHLAGSPRLPDLVLLLTGGSRVPGVGARARPKAGRQCLRGRFAQKTRERWEEHRLKLTFERDSKACKQNLDSFLFALLLLSRSVSLFFSSLSLSLCLSLSLSVSLSLSPSPPPSPPPAAALLPLWLDRSSGC